MIVGPKSLLLVVVALSATVARAGDPSTIVCGVEVKTLTAEGRKAFEVSGTPPAPNYATLRTLLATTGKAWPAPLNSRMTGAFDALEQGALATKAFTLVKSADLPPRQDAFGGTPYAVPFPIEAGAPDCDGQAAARAAAAAFVLLVQSVLADAHQPDIQRTAKAIGVLEAQFDKYLFNGFPMFPWEAAANSWVLTPENIAGGPPRNLIVLMHPAAGVVGTVSSGSKSDIGGSLSIEPVGWIHYSADYEHWYGASLLAAFPTDRSAGYGVAVNFDNYKLGVTWNSDHGSGHNGATIFVGMDLLQFVSKEHRTYSGYLNKVRDAIDKSP